MHHLLRPGRNCWKIAKAERLALLVDGSNYYGTLAEVIGSAQRSIAIVGWDLDSRMHLFGEVQPQQQPQPLWRFLRDVVNQNPELNIYILSWSFPFIFANVRDPQLVFGRDPFNHPRIHFRFDDTHPAGASHHQKIVVIDNCLAFTGGMDLAGGRWDTPQHLAHDERRSGEEKPYPPAHDIQAMIDGDAAKAVAEVVHDRWQRATGMSISWAAVNTRTWPKHIQPDMDNALVGISRTDDRKGATNRREIEQLHMDLIAAGRHSIYIENQYLTSGSIVNAITRCLREPEGPEVLIVLPLKNSGWLEEHTIEVLRFQYIEKLRKTDRFNRLRICYPVVPNLGVESVAVHSKILVVDDSLFRIGSSNLTNRSMRLDTECDLTIEATTSEQHRAIAHLRNRLLGEHLGLPAHTIAKFLETEQSMIRLVDSRSGERRSLRTLQMEENTNCILSPDLIDPSQPLKPHFVIERMTRWIADQALRTPRLIIGLVSVAIVAAGILRRRH